MCAEKVLTVYDTYAVRLYMGSSNLKQGVSLTLDGTSVLFHGYFEIIRCLQRNSLGEWVGAMKVESEAMMNMGNFIRNIKISL